MTPGIRPRPEAERIDFLLTRDGPQATRVWVERTLRMYREELGRPTSYASDAAYRPRFESAVREFEEWLARGAIPAPLAARSGAADRDSEQLG
ncbi:MAG TPA: hypothetical protein VEV20_03155 [Burkholderiales bacterium]|nr:hypothetical protein [Burkholderiales bacterium]